MDFESNTVLMRLVAEMVDGGDDEWGDALGKARRLVSNMTLEEKASLPSQTDSARRYIQTRG